MFLTSSFSSTGTRILCTLLIVRVEGGESLGKRVVARMRGRATSAMTTDELLHLLRDE